MDAVFYAFTLPQAVAVVGEVVKVPRDAKRNKTRFYAALNALPEDVQQRIREVASERVGTKRRAGTSANVPRKRRRVEVEVEVEMEVDEVQEEDITAGPFFQPPTEETTLSRMIDRTSNAALSQRICMVCARLLFLDLLAVMRWQDIPNGRNLVPTRPHPAHKLWGHWLLHEEAADGTTTYICLECKRRLLLDELPPTRPSQRHVDWEDTV
ncbi:hypothetical protein B0H11DRAFT_2259791 [Mycena galericulata]|nr:hypothetical protein B0H11DRAFT_2259791 [Mycena galericulata]